MTVPGLRVEPVTNGGDVAVLIGRGKVGVKCFTDADYPKEPHICLPANFFSPSIL